MSFEKCRLNLSNLFMIVRTFDGGNGNHSVSLPIIFIKIKVDQMLPSLYKARCWSLFNNFAFDFLFP